MLKRPICRHPHDARKARPVVCSKQAPPCVFDNQNGTRVRALTQMANSLDRHQPRGGAGERKRRSADTAKSPPRSQTECQSGDTPFSVPSEHGDVKPSRPGQVCQSKARGCSQGVKTRRCGEVTTTGLEPPRRRLAGRKSHDTPHVRVELDICFHYYRDELRVGRRRSRVVVRFASRGRHHGMLQGMIWSSDMESSRDYAVEISKR